MSKCKHCGDPTDYHCKECGKLLDSCLECHAEKVHGMIQISNVNVCGNIPHKQESDDIDAYRVSTQTTL